MPPEICLLSMSLNTFFTMSPLQATLDAPSLVFLPPAGTCSLRPSLGATLRAAVAVQIVYPDNLSLNQSYSYGFGRRHPLAAKIRRDHRITW